MGRSGYVDVTGGRVWYEIAGANKGIPLILLHGGPGFTHFSMVGLRKLGEDRPIVFYDQLGSGKSDRPNDSSLWRTERFVEELHQVRSALSLSECHILGHSWGTMLLASYLQSKISGVKSAIFSSPCLSASMWEKDQEIYKRKLPEDVQTVILQCEKNGTTDSVDYQSAMFEFYKRHLCRLDPWPVVMEEDLQNANFTVYHTMWGPSEFCATGNLKSFDCTNQLKNIRIPTLFTCGRYDEATPETTQFYSTLVPGSRFHIFENSSHMTYVEEPESYIRTMRSFLLQVENES